MAGERDVLAEALHETFLGKRSDRWWHLRADDALAALAARGWRLMPADAAMSPEELAAIVARDAEIDSGDGFSVMPFVSVAEHDVRDLLSLLRETWDKAQAVVDWADAVQCKFCLVWAGSLFSAHAPDCPVGSLRAALAALGQP